MGYAPVIKFSEMATDQKEEERGPSHSRDTVPSNRIDSLPSEIKPFKKALANTQIVRRGKAGKEKAEDQPSAYNMLFNDAQVKSGSEMLTAKEYNQKDFPFELREEAKSKALKDIQQNINQARAGQPAKDNRQEEKVSLANQTTIIGGKLDLISTIQGQSSHPKKEASEANPDRNSDKSVESVERGNRKHLEMVFFAYPRVKAEA